jgi:host cell surface-exposed lipoprotein
MLNTTHSGWRETMNRPGTIAGLLLASTLLAGCSMTSGPGLEPAATSTASATTPAAPTSAEGVSEACINAVVGVENDTVDAASVIPTCIKAGDSIDAITAYVDSILGTSKPTPKPKPKTTVAQREAIESAKAYLKDGAFSRAGLINQLDSKYGEGFKKADAVYAVDHITVSWYAEAVESARSYLDDGGFSRAGLIEQLHSSYGEGFTLKQATYAANKVGL